MAAKLFVFFCILSGTQFLAFCSAERKYLNDSQSDCTLTIVISPPNAGVTIPSEGTHVYPFNTSVDVFWIHAAFTMLDHWELNGTNVGEGNEPNEASITVTMNASYILTCVYKIIEPFKVMSISPIAATVELGDSVNFVANVTGGIEPYSFQWYVNDTRVAMGQSENWNFMPTAEGTYRVFFKAKDEWSSVTDWKQSNTATVAARSAILEFPSIILPLVLLMTISSLLIAQRRRNQSIE